VRNLTSALACEISIGATFRAHWSLAGAHGETLGVARFPMQIFGNFRSNVGAIVATAAVVSAEVCAIGHIVVGGCRIGIGVGVRVGRLIGVTLA
jgi:hypothetical protein